MNRQVEHKRFKKKHHVNTTQKKAAVAIRGRKKADFRTKYCQYLPILHGDSTHKGPALKSQTLGQNAEVPI